MRHPDTLKAKSKTHSITQTEPGCYEVVSGASGDVYTVRMLNPGPGASCTCEWALWRMGESGGRSGCSHVLAVIAHQAAEEARTVQVYTGWEAAERQHRHILNIGDELIITTRKAG